MTPDDRGFREPFHVGRPNLGDRERFLERVAAIFDRRWLTNNGPLVQEFEARLAEFLGVRHALAVCNGTIGLELAVRALGMQGEVIVPSFTFVATAHAVQWQGITPVFADIDPRTHNLDPGAVERAITPRTTGIIGVHLWGRPCPVDALASLARQHGLKLMFDAAHAFACSQGGRMVGNFGDCEVFSFHATKFFNTFEGGAITTNDDALAERLRLMRNFGFAGYDNVVHIGTNGKMTEVCAAMGLTNLESLDEFVAANRRNYEAYRDGLAGIGGLTLTEYDGAERCNFQYVAIEVDPARFGRSRDDLCQALHEHNILARRYFFPGSHNMEPYRTLYPGAGANLPNTEALCQRVLALPTGTAVSVDDIRRICVLIRAVT